MPNIEEIREIRVKKLKSLISKGENPYPLNTKRTHTSEEALKEFSKLSKDETQVILVGRIMLLRKHGAITFLRIEDSSGIIQIALRRDSVGETKYKLFHEHFDLGDFIEVTGILFKTKTEEKTLDTQDFKILSKSLLPLPEKWHGISDIEERYRKRYLDLIFNKEQKDKFITRSNIISSIREFLEKENFLEVETPILQPLYGGARAKPFKTHLNAYDMDMYLRISPELYLKRLIIGGFEKVYEIGKSFRNEGVDKFHNPDFTELEFYWAYADYKDLMDITEKMFKYITENVLKTTEIKIGENTIDFSKQFERIDFTDLLHKYAKIDYDSINASALEKKAKELGVKVEEGAEKAVIADEIYKKYCRDKIIQPTFIIHHPIGFQALAKRKDEKRLANLQLVVAGAELVNAFSELNDPLEQRERFKEQEEMFKKGFTEAHKSDTDFIEALEYGMPPCAGFGMGIDRLIMLLTDSTNLREIILFPTMKPKNK